MGGSNIIDLDEARNARIAFFRRAGFTMTQFYAALAILERAPETTGAAT